MRFIRQGEASAPQRALAPSRHARDAAIERRLAAYIYMSCGCLTTWEVQEIYAVWRPKGKRWYCEHCHKWTKTAPKPKAAPLPQEPMF